MREASARWVLSRLRRSASARFLSSRSGMEAGAVAAAGVEAGGAGIAHDVLFRLAGGVREVLEGWGKEGEVAHRSDSVSRIAWQVDLALFRGMRFPLLRRDPIRGFLIGLNYSGRACEVRCGQCYKF